MIGHRPLRTFSVAFEDDEFSEAPHARRVASALGTDHTEILVQPNLSADLPKIVRHLGEPLADASVIPTFYLCREARNHMTVALTGDAGDELFGGYDRYRALSMRNTAALAAPKGLRWAAHNLSRRVGESTGRVDRIRSLRRFSEGVIEGYSSWVSLCSVDQITKLLGRSVVDMPPPWTGKGSEDGPPVGKSVARAMEADLLSYLPDDVLWKVDRMSMAWGLEARSPFCDPDVVALALGLPDEERVRPWQTKPLLRRIAERRLGREIAHRPKQGFATPIGRWLSSSLRELARDQLASDGLSGLLDPEAIRQLWAEHDAGVRDHGPVLWALTVFSLWL